MKRFCVLIFTAIVSATTAHADASAPGEVKLLCHRTANEDVPENTLESLEQAALLGCNTVEIDLRRTLDGEIVLNHDGILERLTDGVGTAENTYYDDLRTRDTGAWMGERFAGMHIAKFEDALRVARQYDIKLQLDIKVKETEPDILELVCRDGMMDRIQIGGDANTVWVQPNVTAEQIEAYHANGKKVMVNFTTNGHEMDLAGMKAVVAAGADGLFVDYPRLGADAVGRPVESKLSALAAEAKTGESSTRAKAILQLSRYRGFPLQREFAHWLLDPDDHVSRAAALALATARPQTPPAVFAEALHSEHSDARANAAWAIGVMPSPDDTSLLLLRPLLHDGDPRVLQETLLALARMTGDVDAQSLMPLLAHPNPAVRGAAALALARHQPAIAATAIPARLRMEVQTTVRLNDDFIRRGQPQQTQAEIDQVMDYFRCEIKMVQAMSTLKGQPAIQALEEQALRPNVVFTQALSQVAAFELWDKISADPQPAIEALASPDTPTGDRAEWMLIKAGPAVLPEVRKALSSDVATVRERAIQIVAWQGDTESLQMLRAMQQTDKKDAALIAWAIEKIGALHPKL
jgi:glycerophosphoryl diester phosphodiesterase